MMTMNTEVLVKNNNIITHIIDTAANKKIMYFKEEIKNSRVSIKQKGIKVLSFRITTNGSDPSSYSNAEKSWRRILRKETK